MKKKILITGGATREPIDSVRFISNLSSGQTSKELCEYLAKDFDVRLLLCEGSTLDLEEKLKSLCLEFKPDVVIHAAAVSDYCVTEVEVNGEQISGSALRSLKKIPSSSELKIKLSRNKKIVNEIKRWTSSKLIAFKLTDTLDSTQQEEAVGKLFRESLADAVVQNDMSEFALKQERSFGFYRSPGQKIRCKNLVQLMEELKAYLL